MAQVIPQGLPNAGSRSHLHLSSLKADADGRYDVLLSAERPEGLSMDDPFALPSNIREIQVDRGQAIVIQ